MRGDFDAAESLYEVCLASQMNSLGPVHEKTLKTMFDLGVLNICQGKYDPALKHIKLCETPATGAFGSTHHLAHNSQAHIRCIHMGIEAVLAVLFVFFLFWL
jgi:hypothetical protein